MPRHRRMKIKEESNCFSGEFPEYGAIFMSNRSTIEECLRRKLFGLPEFQWKFVNQVKTGMVLFLFEFESRTLHGVFQAASDGAIDIEPDAYLSSGKAFPAQVRFTEKWRCRPLREDEFSYAICENYFTPKKFRFGLSKDQVERLLKLFSSKVVRPRKSERNSRDTARGYGFRSRYARQADKDVDINDGRVQKKLRRAASGYSDKYHERETCNSNDKERFKIKAEPVVPSQSFLPLESPYGAITEPYDPCYPGIKTSRHDNGAPNAHSTRGGYFSDILPLETVQPCPDECNDALVNKSSSSLGLDYYIPMPFEFIDGSLTSERATDFDRLPSPNRSIFPSFAFPSSSMDLSLGGQVVHDSKIYPSFTDPRPTLGYRDEVEAYQPEEVGRDGREIRVKDCVSSPDEFERKRTRKSVFSRLVMPPSKEELVAEKESSPDIESVDEVMNFLNDCRKQWMMEQERPDLSNQMLPFSETTSDEGNVEQNALSLPIPFIDFKRRSRGLKTHDSPPTQGSFGHSAQDKKRKLLRPKLEDTYGHPENVVASRSVTEVRGNPTQDRKDDINLCTRK